MPKQPRRDWGREGSCTPVVRWPGELTASPGYRQSSLAPTTIIHLMGVPGLKLAVSPLRRHVLHDLASAFSQGTRSSLGSRRLTGGLKSKSLPDSVRAVTTDAHAVKPPVRLERPPATGGPTSCFRALTSPLPCPSSPCSMLLLTCNGRRELGKPQFTTNPFACQEAGSLHPVLLFNGQFLFHVLLWGAADNQPLNHLSNSAGKAQSLVYKGLPFHRRSVVAMELAMYIEHRNWSDSL